MTAFSAASPLRARSNLGDGRLTTRSSDVGRSGYNLKGRWWRRAGQEDENDVIKRRFRPPVMEPWALGPWPYTRLYTHIHRCADNFQRRRSPLFFPDSFVLCLASLVKASCYPARASFRIMYPPPFLPARCVCQRKWSTVCAGH